MADQQAGTPQGQPEQPKDVAAAWEQARAESSEAAPAEAPAETEPADAETPEAAAQTEAPEPDHIKWAKSVNGHFDAATGQLNVDRIAKQAFELQRALGQRETQLNEINSLLRRPDVAEVLAQLAQGRKPAVKEEPKEEAPKTDEDILREFVNKTVAEKYEPKITELNNTMAVLKQNFTRAKVAEATATLRQEFGNDDSNAPVFDSIYNDVANNIAQTAMRAGLDVNQVIEHLAASDQLTSTMRSMAREILFPKLNEAVARSKQAKASPTVPSEVKKKLAMAPKAASSARPAEGEIKSFEDAFNAAKKELKLAAE